MSDEALLIGQPPAAPTPQGATGIQVPTDRVTVSVFGVFKDQIPNSETGALEDEYVEQKFPTQVPRGTPHDDICQFIWLKFLQQACLRSAGSGGEINFYPLDRFKRFTMTVGVIVGVGL
jgi:hypothetical protein